jgi:AcrR family transcriptional regulator
MPTGAAYRTRRRSTRSEQTRERIMSAVRELLAEGSFHELPVEEVAERAGISRATLYQHFRSRVDLIDSICDTFDANPALRELRDAVELRDAEAALAETIALAMRFWASEDPVLAEIYGVEAIDSAARDLVQRQRNDRHGEMKRLARNLRSARRLAPGITERSAVELLMVLSSYETFRELRLAGLSERQLTETLQKSARTLLLA